MPRKVPRKATPEQNREKYLKAKKHREAERARRAAARIAEACAETTPRRVGPGGTGRPFGTTGGGNLKCWVKRILGSYYTDTLLLRDFILLAPKERLAFLQSLDPKNLGQGTPEEIAARIKATLDAIQQTVPDPHEGKTKEVKNHGNDQS